MPLLEREMVLCLQRLKCYGLTKHHLIGVQQLYPFTPFKWLVTMKVRDLTWTSNNGIFFVFIIIMVTFSRSVNWRKKRQLKPSGATTRIFASLFFEVRMWGGREKKRRKIKSCCTKRNEKNMKEKKRREITIEKKT